MQLALPLFKIPHPTQYRVEDGKVIFDLVLEGRQSIHNKEKDDG